jgi:phosphatidylserine decarboxylase
LGYYQSVNPIALAKIPRLYVENKRTITSFHSDHFGEILYVEVGATNVGSIIQTFQPRQQINKGDEKGYFKFGGSTVILFVEKGRLKVDSDIINQSAQGIESRVLFGESIGLG